MEEQTQEKQQPSANQRLIEVAYANSVIDGEFNGAVSQDKYESFLAGAEYAKNSINLKTYYLRLVDYEIYLIPEGEISEFDSLVFNICAEMMAGEKYELEEKFNDKFYGYKCEGELYSTKLYKEETKMSNKTAPPITYVTVNGKTYEDITHELDQFQRGIHVTKSPHGLAVGGQHDGETWLRRTTTDVMEIGETQYRRTGEIFAIEEYGKWDYCIVFRPMDTIKKEEAK